MVSLRDLIRVELEVENPMASRSVLVPAIAGTVVVGLCYLYISDCRQVFKDDFLVFWRLSCRSSGAVQPLTSVSNQKKVGPLTRIRNLVFRVFDTNGDGVIDASEVIQIAQLAAGSGA